MSTLYDDLDETNKAFGGNVMPDPVTDYKVRQQQIANRRKQALELVAAGNKMDTGAGYHGGRVYAVGNILGPLAQSVGGAVMSSQADKQEVENNLQQRMAQSDWQQRYNEARDDATRQQLIVEARNNGLKYDLEQQFAKEEADRIERGEQAAAERQNRADIAEANRIDQGEQRAADRVARADLRSMPTIHISNSGNGQGKAPSGYRWNGDQLEAIPGGPADKAGKPVNLTAAQQKAVDDSDALLGYIDSALEGVKTNPNAIGFKTVIPDMALSKIDPEGVATRAAVAGLSAERVHQLSGAAVSPAEFARLRPYLPASGDTAAAVEKKLTNLRAEVERIRTSHMRGPTKADPNAGKPTVVRTGVLNGRKVEQLSDGTTRYAD